MRVHDDWWLTPERVAVHLPTGTGVLADLHLGYAESRRSRGDAVPVPALNDLLRPLAAVLHRHQVRKVAVAGDLLEDGGSSVIDELVTWFAVHDAVLEAVVPGNHDRKQPEALRRLPLFPDGYQLDGWLVVHGDRALPAGPVVCGHIHPSVRLVGKRRPCYVAGPGRLVLPAYSPDARGTIVTASPGQRCLVPVGTNVVDFDTGL
jgi:metallophosphoesterase superfamily enzyme